jgi:hypothetical protein
MKSNWDKYLDPPDEPEAVLCESCGQEMEGLYFGDEREFSCINPHCPNKHTGVAKEMAEMIVELTDEVNTLRHKLAILQRQHGKLLL